MQIKIGVEVNVKPYDEIYEEEEANLCNAIDICPKIKNHTIPCCICAEIFKTDVLYTRETYDNLIKKLEAENEH